MNNMPGHGGDIYRLAGELKLQERKVIDFSSSVNPLGVSKKVKAELRRHLKYLHNYPDTETERLRKRLAQYYGIDPETILCGNGSSEIIRLIITTLRPKHVLVPSPTYSEYERTCRLISETQISYLVLKKENDFDTDPDEFIRAMHTNNNSTCDMAFLCNPNNPTGKLLGRSEVEKIAEAAQKQKCYLIVDEAFIDFCPDSSVIKNVSENPYLIVLRTMSHFYSLTGLRIGFGIFPVHIAEELKTHREPWTVNSLAQRAALAALKDKVFLKETMTLISREKRFIEKQLNKMKIKFYASEANYYLLNMNNAMEVHGALRKRGILVRTCLDFKGLDSTYLRIAVKSHEENAMLMKELVNIANDR